VQKTLDWYLLIETWHHRRLSPGHMMMLTIITIGHHPRRLYLLLSTAGHLRAQPVNHVQCATALVHHQTDGTLVHHQLQRVQEAPAHALATAQQVVVEVGAQAALLLLQAAKVDEKPAAHVALHLEHTVGRSVAAKLAHLLVATRGCGGAGGEEPVISVVTSVAAKLLLLLVARHRFPTGPVGRGGARGGGGEGAERGVHGRGIVVGTRVVVEGGWKRTGKIVWGFNSSISK